MKIKEVQTNQDKREFLDLPLKIYKDDPNWAQPLDKDIEAIFNEETNKLFQVGKCKRWLLFDDQNECIGRVATFINPKYNPKEPVGGIGFFEIIEDKEAAFFLLDHCKKWLEDQGMEAMDGPINFGERDRWWGMVTKGFFEPLYCMNYNPPYYVDFFEEYGFQLYFKQLCFGMEVTLDLLKDRFFIYHEKVSKNPNIRVEHISKKNINKYAKDFSYIYNLAWAQHNDGKMIDDVLAIKMFQAMKPVLDEQLCWFAYENDEPVAGWINLPDLNFYFKELNGKFGLLQKLKFLWLKKTRPNPKINGIVFGVIPRWQGRGMDAYLIVEGAQRFIPVTAYKEIEMQWVGDFNPKMVNVTTSLGAEVTRELTTYRYLFDRNRKFERHPILD